MSSAVFVDPSRRLPDTSSTRISPVTKPRLSRTPTPHLWPIHFATACTFRQQRSVCDAAPEEGDPSAEYRPSDEERVVGLSLRAWRPVFGPVDELLGPDLVLRPLGGWRAGQAKEVRDVLADAAHRVWLADIDAQPGGFVARLHRDSALGEI